MTDITELAQRMKTAAEKLDADQWQTRKGFSGIEVIVKGSLEKGHGCVSFQPVAADMADTKTARAIALFSPANVLALVEALEKAQQRIDELESRTVTAEKLQESANRAGLTAGWNLGLDNNNDGFNKCLAAHAAGIKVEAE
ncbi:ead/Ea22-like family protein [Klebsiella quasipneumoniae]|uniref:RelE family toxin-antitoxin system n=1 Tax=Klebsiella quasipneumoniae TaxID=1463165 RepID=A0ABD7N5T9_9ENTR|nr:ead/Ea22-like family protein [Klebsiella quasipneumoniae]SSF98037.1 RelE family toxin-antitoxin system [Klebsiella quasipneumoniae]SSG52272.1 RelE family toxin-antitoxin system [Klebsiella quasipneumoniae]